MAGTPSLKGSVMHFLFGAAGARRGCAPALPRRRRSLPPQLHRYMSGQRMRSIRSMLGSASPWLIIGVWLLSVGAHAAHYVASRVDR